MNMMKMWVANSFSKIIMLQNWVGYLQGFIAYNNRIKKLISISHSLHAVFYYTQICSQ